jgi:hypothetical protein
MGGILCLLFRKKKDLTSIPPAPKIVGISSLFFPRRDIHKFKVLSKIHWENFLLVLYEIIKD